MYRWLFAKVDKAPWKVTVFFYFCRSVFFYQQLYTRVYVNLIVDAYHSRYHPELAKPELPKFSKSCLQPKLPNTRKNKLWSSSPPRNKLGWAFTVSAHGKLPPTEIKQPTPTQRLGGLPSICSVITFLNGPISKCFAHLKSARQLETIICALPYKRCWAFTQYHAQGQGEMLLY